MNSRLTERLQWIGFVLVAMLFAPGMIARAGHTEFQVAQKLTASDGATLDRFGGSVSMSGTRVLVGASRNDSDRGAAYIFDSGVQTAKLTANDAIEGDGFGRSVSLSGDRALVGAVFADGSAPNSGSAYIFDRQADGSWLQTAKLTHSDGATSDNFGGSVSLIGDRALVGSCLDDDNGDKSGSAYVFERQPGGNWLQTAKLTASDGAAEDLFGCSLALSGDRAIVGADGNAGNQGAAYIFNLQLNGWVQEAKLTASNGVAGDRFGDAVALTADRALIGAPGQYGGEGHPFDAEGISAGAAYVFESQGNNTWLQTAELSDDVEGGLHQRYGDSVALLGNRALIGAIRGQFVFHFPPPMGTGYFDFYPGAAYVLERLSNGTWVQTNKFYKLGDQTDDVRFSSSVALSGNRGVVGADEDEGNAVESGAAYILENRPNLRFLKEFIEVCFPPCFPDRNLDRIRDRLVEVRGRPPSEYLVRLSFSQPGLPPAMVEDVVPAAWDVEVISTGQQTAVPSARAAAAEPEDLILVEPVGGRGPKGYQATRIRWFPTRNTGDLVYRISLRRHSARQYLPNKPGCLPLPPAAALDTSGRGALLGERGQPLVSNSLAIAAVSDANGDGMIDFTGDGDEDGDGLGDFHEACVLGTDPCDPDTDNDGIPDGEDPDPLERNRRTR